METCVRINLLGKKKIPLNFVLDLQYIVTFELYETANNMVGVQNQTILNHTAFYLC